MIYFILFYWFIYNIFVSIPQIFAWLFYDTFVEAKCYGMDIHTYSRGMSIDTYMEYSYKGKGYTKRMFMFFNSSKNAQIIKIRSDKPWKAVSIYECLLGVVSIIASIPPTYFLFFSI